MGISLLNNLILQSLSIKCTSFHPTITIFPLNIKLAQTIEPAFQGSNFRSLCCHFSSLQLLHFLMINRAEPLDTLENLLNKGNKEVTVLEMQKKAGTDIGGSTRWTVMAELRRLGVNVMTDARALSARRISEVRSARAPRGKRVAGKAQAERVQVPLIRPRGASGAGEPGGGGSTASSASRAPGYRGGESDHHQRSGAPGARAPVRRALARVR